jgi:hypothetical protein
MSLLHAQGAKAAERRGWRERTVAHLPRESKESVVSEARLAHHAAHEARRLYIVRTLAGSWAAVSRAIIKRDINGQ